MVFTIYYYIFIILLILTILIIISFFTLWERKLMAGIQRRHGPTFIGNFGILQAIADGLKLLAKEQNITYGVNFYIFLISAVASVVLSILSWSFIPFNDNFIFTNINLNLYFILLLSSLNVYSVLFSGWSSNSKYGTLGSIRAAAQVIAYEIPMFLTIFPIIILVKSLNLNNIVFFQINNFWFIIFVPSLLIFYTTALAETNRTPFDLPEAESELIAGYNIEYSSILFAFFFLGEYNHILIMSALLTLLFLGAWDLFCFNFTYLIYPVMELLYVKFQLKHLASFIIFSFKYPQFLTVISLLQKHFFYQSLIFFFKVILIASTFVITRAILPRYKYTQLIKLCWETLIPFLITYNIFIFIFIF